MDILTNDSPPVPPEHYESWLEYAIVSFDARSAAVDFMFEDNYRTKTDEIRKALWSEFNELRARAGLPPWQPPLLQLLVADHAERPGDRDRYASDHTPSRAKD